MPFQYLDTSAIVKRYVTEKGSAWIEELCEARVPDSEMRVHTILIGELTLLEVASAITQRVKKTKQLDEQEGNDAYNLFFRHAREEYTVEPWSRYVLNQAIELAQKHALRAYDAAQLAFALYSNNLLKEDDISLTFVTSDKTLLEAAQAEGLAAENPQDHAD